MRSLCRCDKRKIGKRHPYYLNISTRIVDNAIANVVSEVNEAQLSEDFETLKKALIEAWRTQLYMDKFDLEPEYRDGRYKQIEMYCIKLFTIVVVLNPKSFLHYIDTVAAGVMA